MPKIVALSGKARSGKTTAAKILAKALSNKAAVESFAKPLKNMVQEQFSYVVSPHDLIHNKNKVIEIGGNKMTVRELMIRVGRMYRDLDKEFWIKKLLYTVELHANWGCEYVVIDDMRYADEFEILSSKNAVLLRVERPGVELIDDESEWALDGHPFASWVVNDRGLDDYEKKILDLAGKIKAGIVP